MPVGRTPRRRWAGPLALLAVVCTSVASPAVGAAPAAPDNQTEASQLAQQLEAQGRRISVLDEQYNQARLRVDAVAANRSQADQVIASEQAALQKAQGELAPLVAAAAQQHTQQAERQAQAKFGAAPAAPAAVATTTTTTHKSGSAPTTTIKPSS